MKWKASHGDCVVMISKDEILTNFENIMSVLNNNLYNKNIAVMVTGIEYTDNKKDVPYIYNTEEIKNLIYINNFLERHGHHDSILFNEAFDFSQGVDPNTVCWSLSIVLEVNQKIDSIVNKIRSLNLSPYETILYIHKLASQIRYSAKGEIFTSKRETEATLIGLSDDYKHLCCVGYASFVKAIIEKLGDKNLRATVDTFSIYNKTRETNDPKFITGHAVNIISIYDEKYNINGYYMEDATPFESPEGPVFTLCLLPIPDMEHFKNEIFRHVPLKSTNGNIHCIVPIDAKMMDKIKDYPMFFRNAYLKVDYQWLPFKDKRTQKYSRLNYTHINIETFEFAYTILLKKLNEKNISQQVAVALDLATRYAADIYDQHAENCFAQEIYGTYDDTL